MKLSYNTGDKLSDYIRTSEQYSEMTLGDIVVRHVYVYIYIYILYKMYCNVNLIKLVMTIYFPIQRFMEIMILYVFF